MVGMPYHLEKGPWFAILEDYLNGQDGRSLEFLMELRRLRSCGGRLTEIEFLDSPALDSDEDNGDPDARRIHLGDDWFGGPANGDGFVAALEAKLCDTAPAVADRLRLPEREPITEARALRELAAEVAQTVEETEGARLNGWPVTGFWFQYFGDVDAIVRETLIRSIEVSLGLDHDQEPGPDGPPFQLPIELFWKCPQRWFEGWVSWRWDARHGTGQVTTMLATPGSGKPVLEHPQLGQDPHGIPRFLADEPVDGPRTPAPGVRGDAPNIYPKGLWVVTHRQHAKLATTPDDGGTESGRWFIPPFGPTYVGVGDVICYQPVEFDGGTNPAGRPWVPPQPSSAS